MHSINCPYCKGKAELHHTSNIVYNGKDFGPIYLCENYPLCDSYVGCHPGTTNPLGRLANSELRYWKKQAHTYFDVLWREKKIDQIYSEPSKSHRSKAYKWLSVRLDIAPEETHIGMFDVDTCKKVVEICKIL